MERPMWKSLVPEIVKRSEIVAGQWDLHDIWRRSISTFCHKQKTRLRAPRTLVFRMALNTFSEVRQRDTYFVTLATEHCQSRLPDGPVVLAYSLPVAYVVTAGRSKQQGSGSVAYLRLRRQHPPNPFSYPTDHL